MRAAISMLRTNEKHEIFQYDVLSYSTKTNALWLYKSSMFPSASMNNCKRICLGFIKDEVNTAFGLLFSFLVSGNYYSALAVYSNIKGSLNCSHPMPLSVIINTRMIFLLQSLSGASLTNTSK